MADERSDGAGGSDLAPQPGAKLLHELERLLRTSFKAEWVDGAAAHAISKTGGSVEIPPPGGSFMPSVGAPTDAAAAMALLQDHWDEASTEGRCEAGYIAAAVFGWQLAGLSHEARVGRPPGM